MRSPFKKRSTPTSSAASKSPLETQRSRTEKIAYELYQTRQLLNRSGDTHTDWAIAERIVQSRLRLTLYCCHRPFIRLEKNTWEPLLAWANNQALLSLLGLVGNIGLIIAVATYIGSEKQRRNAEVQNAWQTITNAHGQAGSGGRIQALEFLNASPGANWRRKFPWVCAPLSVCLWPAESLDGINFAAEGSDKAVGISQRELSENATVVVRTIGVYLQELQLPRASLRSANLEGVSLRSANLEEAFLRHATLERADLRFAKLERADLQFANLKEGFLRDANLEKADLQFANLKGADLRDANLKRVDLQFANLEDTNLVFSNLEGAFLQYTNLKGVSGLTAEQLAHAKLCNTQLPEDIDLPADRDCE